MTANDVMVKVFRWGARIPHLTNEFLRSECDRVENAFLSKCAVLDIRDEEIAPSVCVYPFAEGWFCTLSANDKVVNQFHGRTMEQSIACMMIWISAISR